MITVFEFLTSQGYKIEDYSFEVTEAEKDLEITFADEYRQLISVFGNFEISSHEFTGVEFDNFLNIVIATLDNRQYTHSDTQSMYVIEELGFDGIVIWQNTKGEIFQTIPNDTVKPEKLYSSFEKYVLTEVIE
ncbi:SMI1/KNR4 family protein [Streptococcus sp. S784/96/1]|uniref:SMI1/KNR4 family protein n=1 Tax=Streptococcus sp. S784/96/1 TaxID=2653499 RepID=UPI0013873D4A|nr:SMI1/KNR4 family protein [Streptococcus sp. S784/96/1]